MTSRQLVAEFNRIAEGAGADVRLDVGVPFRAKAWPRAGIQAGLWRWRIIHGYRWTDKVPKHINLLELRAAVTALQWRLRARRGVSRKVLHLVDSQVVAAILAKSRSSSRLLRAALRRYNALLLAGNCVAMVGFVASEDNPADIPSRWAATSQKKQRPGRSQLAVKRR